MLRVCLIIEGTTRKFLGAGTAVVQNYNELSHAENWEYKIRFMSITPCTTLKFSDKS